jgi:hypothetical protein
LWARTVIEPKTNVACAAILPRRIIIKTPIGKHHDGSINTKGSAKQTGGYVLAGTQLRNIKTITPVRKTAGPETSRSNSSNSKVVDISALKEGGADLLALKDQRITGLIEGKPVYPIPVRRENTVQNAGIMDGSFCGVTTS